MMDDNWFRHCTRNQIGVATCGRPAEYEIFGEPCCCTVLFRREECAGHAVCEQCAADLRLNARKLHRDRDETFRVTRVRTLAALEAS